MTGPSRSAGAAASPHSRPFVILVEELTESTVLLTVEGELDLYTAPRLKSELLRAMEEGARRIAIDLTKVGFMDSTGLGVLLAAQRRHEEVVSFAIVCSDPEVRWIFEFSGTDRILALFHTLEEALAHLDRDEREG